MTTVAPPRTPRRSTLDRPTAMRLAAQEYTRVGELFDALDAEQWTAPTSCPPWTVREMACHMLGMVEMAASVLEQQRQMSRAAKAEGVFIDELTALQVAKHADDTPAEITRRWHRLAERAARGRRRVPPFIRSRALPHQQEVNGAEEVWTIGYLTETILTRDPWMHRLDIAEATGVGPAHTADHDGVVVDDLVHEWALRHGQPFRLRLTGPAGGSWAFGGGGTPEIELDAVEFARQIGGRSTPHGLMTTQVPY